MEPVCHTLSYLVKRKYRTNYDNEEDTSSLTPILDAGGR